MHGSPATNRPKATDTSFYPTPSAARLASPRTSPTATAKPTATTGIAELQNVDSRGAGSAKRTNLGLTPAQRWEEIGFPGVYNRLARRLWPNATHAFFQHHQGELRFVVPARAWRQLLPGLEGRAVADDVRDQLEKLGVRNPSVEVLNAGPIWDTARTQISLRPADAALLLDAHSALAGRVRRLLRAGDQSPSFVAIRRGKLPDDGDREHAETNVLALPVAAAETMYPIRRCTEHLGISLLDACKRVAQERGISSPRMFESRIDNIPVILMSTEQARVLLRPVDRNDDEVHLSLNPTGFDPTQRQYCGKTAEFSAALSLLIYREPEQVIAYLRRWLGNDNLQPADVRFLSDARSDAQGVVVYDRTRNCVLVAFRGTSSVDDWKVVLRTSSMSAEEAGSGQIQAGFATQYRGLKDSLEAACREFSQHAAETGKPKPVLLVAGHSLGGALALLCAVDFARQNLTGSNRNACFQHCAVYTFGQPRVGDEAFCKVASDLLERSGTTYVRLVNHRDIVPSLPPWSTHIGSPVMFDGNGDMITPDLAPSEDDLLLDSLTEPVQDHAIAHYLELVRFNRHVA